MANDNAGDEMIMNNLNEDIVNENFDPEDPDNTAKGSRRGKATEIDDIHRVPPHILIPASHLAHLARLPRI